MKEVSKGIVQELTKRSLEDIFLWSDGTWCYREEYYDNEMQHMSDDFIIINIDTDEYNNFFKGLNYE